MMTVSLWWLAWLLRFSLDGGEGLPVIVVANASVVAGGLECSAGREMAG